MKAHVRLNLFPPLAYGSDVNSQLLLSTMPACLPAYTTHSLQGASNPLIKCFL